MPTYQVHVAKEGKSFDPEAVELPDTKTAKRHAKTLAERLTALSSGLGVSRLRDCKVNVTDTEGVHRPYVRSVLIFPPSPPCLAGPE